MSAPSLKEFITEIKTRNIARQNLFYMQVIPPTGLAKKIDSDLVSMWCHAAQTPHMFLMTNDNFIENGVRRKVPYDVDYQNLVLSFYVDQDFKVKQFFDDWKQLTVPYNRKFNYYDDYIAKTLTLNLLNQEDKVTYKYEYENVYPKTINSMELSYMGNTILNLNIEFCFEDVYYTATDSNDSSKYTAPIGTKMTVLNKEISQQQYDWGGALVDELGNVIRGN